MACRMEASWRAGASSRLFPLARFCCSGTRTRPGTDERAWSRLRGKRLLRRAPGANGSLGRLVVHPRFGVAGELDDLVGKLAVDEVGQGDGFEDGPHAGADGDPDVLEVFGGAGGLDGFWPLAAGGRPAPAGGGRRLAVARAAVATSWRCSAPPVYSTASGHSPRTFASGPSTARMMPARQTSPGRRGRRRRPAARG